MTLHEELQKQFNKVTSHFGSDEIQLTPYFNIGKNIPENLHQYNRFQNRKKLSFLPKYFFSYILRLNIYIFRALIHHMYYLNDYKKYYKQCPRDFKRVFVSHFTGIPTQLNNPDRYFGGMVPKIDAKKEKNLILLINHTKKLPERKKKLKSFTSPKYLILPKTTNTYSVLNIYVKQLRNFFYILCISQKRSVIQRSERLYMYELAIQQLSQAALSQQFLLSNLSYALKNANAQDLYLTYEGHSYETYLARKIQGIFTKIRINVYQFAPVVPSQISFYKNLEILPKSVKIHVSGKSIQRQILEKTNILGSQINIKGSSNAKKHIDIDDLEKHGKFTILFAPEGMRDSFLEFVDVAVTCTQYLTECRVVIRAHPDTLQNEKHLIGRIFSEKSNLHLSNNSLEKDLKQANICIYRSSAVGIQGLQYGVIPIHFSKFNDGSIDPIRRKDLKHLRINDSSTLINAIDKYMSMPEKKLLKLQKSFPTAFQKYFSELSIG